jgi:hypothetical protein
MNEIDDNTPQVEEQTPQKPKPPLPPPPGTAPPPPAERAPMPAYEAVPRPPKTPALAAFLAFLFPGMGHLYSWAYERAFMIWATIAVCIFLIIQGHWPFSFVIAFVYFFSIFDAYREAQFFNLRAAEEEIPQQRSDSQGRLMFGVFLAVVAVVVLADKLNIFDMEWVYDWWPVPVLALGVYLIVAAIKDRGKQRQAAAVEDDDIS